MKKNLCLALMLLVGMTDITAQTAPLDSIFTSEGLVLANVKSVEPDVIKFAYPNEEVVNSIYKNTVKKICFKSGRTQTFAEAFALKTIMSAYDYDQVSLSRLESETKGLIKLDEVFTKAVGTTTLSNIVKVKERAFRKMKIQAAMLGGNLVYMLDQSTTGNQVGGYYQSGKATETILSGIVYTNSLPKFEDFKKIIGDKRIFQSYSYISIGKNSTDIEDEMGVAQPVVMIDEIYEEKGFIYLRAKVKGIENQIFRVAFVEKEAIGVTWKDDKRLYNIYFNPMFSSDSK